MLTALTGSDPGWLDRDALLRPVSLDSFCQIQLRANLSQMVWWRWRWIVSLLVLVILRSQHGRYLWRATVGTGRSGLETVRILPRVTAHAPKVTANLVIDRMVIDRIRSRSSFHWFQLPVEGTPDVRKWYFQRPRVPLRITVKARLP